jgi:hypothetical protein
MEHKESSYTKMKQPLHPPFVEARSFAIPIDRKKAPFIGYMTLHFSSADNKRHVFYKCASYAVKGHLFIADYVIYPKKLRGMIISSYRQTWSRKAEELFGTSGRWKSLGWKEKRATTINNKKS